MSWQTVKIGDTCEVKRGKTITEKQAQAGNVPVVAGGLTYSYTHNAANRDGMVITVSGSGANAGYVNFWNQPIFASDCSTIQSISDSVDIKFVFYFLKSKQQFINSTLRSGAAQPHVYAKDIAQMIMPLPPLAEQKRIAAILDKAAEIKAKREKAIAKLDELAQSMFVEMFGDPHLNTKSFEICKIGNLLESADYGTSVKSSQSGTYPVLRMNNITATGEMDFTNLKYMELDQKDFDKYLAKDGDILFNRTNSPELVGKTALFESSQPYAFAGYLIRLRTNENAEPAYIAGFLNTKYAKKTLRNMCKSIIGMANINAKEIQAMPIPKPPLILQSKYKHIMQHIKKNKKVHQQALSAHLELISNLQHQAFTTGFSA